jgi:WhiB family redox-sensing transcriptional regulator
VADRNARVAAIANAADANGMKANQAIVAAFGVTLKTAGKMLTAARKAGYDIEHDPRARNQTAITPEQRRSMIMGQFESRVRLFDPAPWRADANCKDVDVNLFFPERGDGSTVMYAKQVCRGCTVRLQCLQFAVNNNETIGIWGGTSERQRRLIRSGYISVKDIA